MRNQTAIALPLRLKPVGLADRKPFSAVMHISNGLLRMFNCWQSFALAKIKMEVGT